MALPRPKKRSRPPQQVDSYTRLLNYSFRLLGRKNYSCAEITKKLARRAKLLELTDFESARDRVITRLKELGYIDDERLMRDYFTYKLPVKPQGKHAFLYEMHRQGISRDRAKEKWEEAAIDERTLADKLVDSHMKKFAALPHPARVQKIAQLLARRGFSSHTIWDLIDRLPR